MIEVRRPILIGDAGALLHFAARGPRHMDRPIILVDRLGEAGKQPEIRAWIATMGDIIQRVKTREGVYIDALRNRVADELDLEKALRHSVERAVRDYVESVEAIDVDEILVLHQDNDVEHLVRAATVPVCVMRATDYPGIT